MSPIGNDTVLTDHLGSAQVTAAEGGAASGVQRYSAFGEVRSRGGEMPTVYQYTGQLSQMEQVGLYHYGARWFDPAGAHFTQADTLVPEPQDVPDWDRYAYGRGNPLKYTDPTGHMVDDGGDDGAWWDEYTPIYILENVHDDLVQDQMLVAYMYEHPDYNPSQDTEIYATGCDPLTMDALLTTHKFRAEARRLDLRKMSLSEFWDRYAAPVVVASIILGGGDDNLQGEGAGSSTTPLRGHLAFESAQNFGYTQRISARKSPFNSHGQPVFFNPKTRTYITPDVDAHNGGVWKMFDRKGIRIGTYDGELNRIGK